MAIARDTPKCPFCGAKTAKGVYANKGKNFIGDTFMYWQTIPHTCEEYEKHIQKISDSIPKEDWDAAIESLNKPKNES